jgi:hypothetical protein
MIPIHELKVGDYVIAEFEDTKWEGEVERLNTDEKQICVRTEVQDFWYDEEQLFPIPLSDESLLRLNFVREESPDGSVKYKKGSFRILIRDKNDFSSYKEIWYREDRRDNPDIRHIHLLQNQYLQMTKVHLTNEVMV